MSTENTTIQRSDLSRLSGSLRLVHARRAPSRAHHRSGSAERFSDPLARDDVRWVFAANVQMHLTHGDGENHSSMIETGRRMGLSDMQSRAIIGIVEQAVARGGLDRAATRQLQTVPAPDTDHELSERARWLVLGVLLAWALLVALLMRLM